MIFYSIPRIWLLAVPILNMSCGIKKPQWILFGVVENPAENKFLTIFSFIVKEVQLQYKYSIHIDNFWKYFINIFLSFTDSVLFHRTTLECLVFKIFSL